MSPHLFPHPTGLLFDASAIPRGWIRVGGILFALIGMQYFGAGLNDTPLPAATPQSQVRGIPISSLLINIELSQ